MRKAWLLETSPRRSASTGDRGNPTGYPQTGSLVRLSAAVDPLSSFRKPPNSLRHSRVDTTSSQLRHILPHTPLNLHNTLLSLRSILAEEILLSTLPQYQRLAFLSLDRHDHLDGIAIGPILYNLASRTSRLNGLGRRAVLLEAPVSVAGLWCGSRWVSSNQ